MQKIKFIKKSIIFIILVIVAALLIESFLTQRYDLFKTLNEALSDQNPKVVFFGDSVIQTVSKTDKDKRSMAEFLEEYSGKDVVTIAHAAYHLGVFEAVSNYICKNDKLPELAIIPINLHSFSPVWDMRPGYQFEYEINIFNNYQPVIKVKYLYDRIIKLLEGGQESSTFEWVEEPVYYNGQQMGIIRDYENISTSTESLTSRFILDYLYNLDGDHRKIMSLKNLIKNYQNCDVPIFVYLTPINYESGEKYVGENFNKIVKNNLNVFKEIEQIYNIKIHDLTFKLNKTYFDEPNAPDEHLNEKGRKYVASYISKEIKNIQTK